MEDGLLYIYSSVYIFQNDGKTPWLFAHGDHISLFTRQGKHCLLLPATGKVTERQLPTPSRPLEDVQMHAGKLLLLGRDGLSLYILEANNGKLVKAFDLCNQSGVSLSRFGARIVSGSFWDKGIALTVGEKLLYWNESSNSVVPILSSTELGVIPGGKTGSHLAVFEKGSNRVVVLSNAKSPMIELKMKSNSPLMCLTSDAKYLVCVEDDKHLKLWRTRDQQLIADYAMEERVVTVNVTRDDKFVLVATRDRRLYSYVIADPLEPSHRERIQSLPSRNQHLVTDRLDIMCDPRYKQVRKMTYVMETSSYQSSDPDPYSTDDDVSYSEDDDNGGEVSTTPTEKKPPPKKSSQGGATSASLNVDLCDNNTHKNQYDLMTTGLCASRLGLQSTTKQRLSSLKSNTGDGIVTASQKKTDPFKPWMTSSSDQKRQRPLDKSFTEKESRACHLM